MKKLFLAVVILVLGAGAFNVYAEGNYSERVYDGTEEYRESYRDDRHHYHNENRSFTNDERIQDTLEDGRISEEANNWENRFEERETYREENDYSPRRHHSERRNRFGQHPSNRGRDNNRRNLGHCRH